ncbi:unnamed protein product, partial [Darwinula stevensoni]
MSSETMIKWKDAILRGPSQCISSPRKAIEIHENRFQSARPIRCVSPKDKEPLNSLHPLVEDAGLSMAGSLTASQASLHTFHHKTPFLDPMGRTVSLMSGLHCCWKYDRHLFQIDKWACGKWGGDARLSCFVVDDLTEVLTGLPREVRHIQYIWPVVWVERRRTLPCEGHHSGEMIHTHFKWFKWLVQMSVVLDSHKKNVGHPKRPRHEWTIKLGPHEPNVLDVNMDLSCRAFRLWIHNSGLVFTFLVPVQ